MSTEKPNDDTKELEDLRGCLLAAGYEIGQALLEAETEIAAEKLAGNKIKEDMAKMRREGLVQAAEICSQRLRMPSPENLEICVQRLRMPRPENLEVVSSVYLCLITWPDGTEGLLFPRPGNVAVADVAEQGHRDFETACRHLAEFGRKNPSARGVRLRLVRLEVKETLNEAKFE